MDLTPKIDINADMGEGFLNDAEILPHITSANIACGFHAGDPTLMRATIRAAIDAGVSVGAHPSLNDREGFGRRELRVSPSEVFDLTAYQVGAFYGVCRAAGTLPWHVKPHGALYHMACKDPAIARAIVDAVIAIDRRLALFAPSGSVLARTGKEQGLKVAHEAFADRNYLADGNLAPRGQPDALVTDPVKAAARILRMLEEDVVESIDGTTLPMTADTICVHSDTPGAATFAHSLREALAQAGIRVAAF